MQIVYIGCLPPGHAFQTILTRRHGTVTSGELVDGGVPVELDALRRVKDYEEKVLHPGVLVEIKEEWTLAAARQAHIDAARHTRSVA